MKRLHIFLLAIVLTGATVLQVVGAWQDSQTIDEGGHIVAGVIHWQSGHFEFNNAHPPLTKMLAALPVLLLSPDHIDPSLGLAARINLLYPDHQSWHTAQQRMFAGRLPMIVFWLALALCIYGWATSRWGAMAGLVATTFYVFDPNFLGHGHLINTDVPVTAGFFATFWLLDRYLSQPTRQRLWVLAMVFGLTLITKFSAVILFPLVFGIAFVQHFRDRQTFTWRWWWTFVGTITLASVLIIELQYGFSPVTITKYIPLNIPAGEYLIGLRAVLLHNDIGHGSQFLGQTLTNGTPLYFPTLILTKTPLWTLGAILSALGLGLWTWLRKKQWWWQLPLSFWTMVVPPVVFFGLGLIAQINIGLRHIFIVYPFLFLLAGSVVSKLRTRFAVGVAAVGTLVCALLAFPNTIGYYNALVGGTNNGHNVALDSNLDWGQDVWRVREYLDQQKYPLVRVGMFGSIPMDYVFPESQSLIRNQEIESGIKPTGVIIVSANVLYKNGSTMSWLKDITPTKRIGSSALVYDLR